MPIVMNKEGIDEKKATMSEGEDGLGASTILMEGIREEKDGYSDCGDHQLEPDSKHSMEDGAEHHHDLKMHQSPDFEQGTFIWPSLPYQPSPFACVSMMLGKDPTSIYSPTQFRQVYASGYSPGTTSTTLSPTLGAGGGSTSLSPSSPLTDPASQLHHQEQQLLSAAASEVGLHYDPPAPYQEIPVTPGTVAVIAATPDTSATTNSSSSNNSKVQAASDKSSNSKSHHDLSPMQGLPAMIAKEGINSFPSRTAIMMLRTLELQETI